MDKNNVIGLTLIFILFFVWAKINAPTEAELNEKKRLQDSIAMAQGATQPIDKLAPVPTNTVPTPAQDSIARAQAAAQAGSFGSATSGTEQEIVLENELVKITFTNKGGRVKQAELKNYYKHVLDSAKNEIKTPLLLLEDEKNRFDYILPVNSVAGGKLNTGNLFFQPTQNGNTVSFKLPADGGGYFEQKYTLKPGSYRMDYNVTLSGMGGQLTGNEIQLDWTNYLDKIELNHTFERTYSSIYYKEADDSPSYCSCTGDDKEEFEANEKLKWIAHSNQFFQSSLTAKEYFEKGVLETVMMDTEDTDLKKIRSNLSIPITNAGDTNIAMDMFIGPKEYNLLKAYDNEMEYTIAFGPSIFGTINRYMIRPLFNFLSQFIGSKGIVILALTFLVKMLLYPFMYKMIYSQSKMAALKPQIAAMGDKFKDDPQAKQMETMKLYREFGVNPMGGCLPVVLQMPIWFALYRFFPSSIEFRQQPFLWATDLSSYDVFAWLPFNLPFYGEHMSLFTLLWAISTVAYTYYNSRHMDMSANPMMKYMQYMMPIMFLFFFNNYASGLTCYLLFSNVFNVAQMVITKNYLIDKKKIEDELQNYKNKPKKKKSGFSAKLEEAMKEQKKRLEAQEKQNVAKAKGKKKKKK